MSNEKIKFLKSTNNLYSHPESINNELFKTKEFFDPHDKAQVKYELLRAYYVNQISVTEDCKQFGFSRETFYTVLRKFKKYGIQSLINEKKGRKSPHKITLEVSGYMISLKAKDPTLSGSNIAKKVKEKFKVSLSKRSVERELNKFGFLLKKRRYYF